MGSTVESGKFLIFWTHCLGYVSQSFVQASVPSWPDQCLHWAIHKKYFLYPYLPTYHHTTQNILWHFWKIKISLICIKIKIFSHYPAVKGDFFPTCPTKIYRVSKCLSATNISFYYVNKTYEPRHEKTCLMLHANNKGADQPAHPRSLISTIVVRCIDSIIPYAC